MQLTGLKASSAMKIKGCLFKALEFYAASNPMVDIEESRKLISRLSNQYAKSVVRDPFERTWPELDKRNKWMNW